jgi:hypothetical protein
MFDRRLRAASILRMLGIASVMPAFADGPPAGFKQKADGTFISPDRNDRRAAQASTMAESDGFSATNEAPYQALNRWHRPAKSVCCSPKPPPWP